VSHYRTKPAARLPYQSLYRVYRLYRLYRTSEAFFPATGRRHGRIPPGSRCRAGRPGGVVARETFRQEVAVETKADETDVVTVADRDAQQQVVATVGQEFPGDPVLCEDEGPVVGGVDSRESVPTSGPVWVVDPIDGTADYVRGLRYWATVVAALVDGAPVGVAIYLPGQEDIYAAGPESVTHNGNPMCVSDRADPETFALGAVGR
jgi:myo-inositol-1(or 4)-monophosphatase